MIPLWTQPDTVSFFGSFISDHLSLFFRGLIALSALGTILMSIRYVEQTGSSLGEFMTILLTATVGGMFIAAPKNWCLSLWR